MKRIAIFALALISASAFAAEDAAFDVSAFKFATPDGWKKVQPASGMRKAQLEAPGKDGGKSAEITFFHFGSGGGSGGDVKANTDRWLGQFTAKEGAGKTEQQEFGGVKVTLVSTEGTMKAQAFGGPKQDEPGFALLGAIMEHAEGPVFVKMTGPSTLVTEGREKFIAMIKSAAEKK